MTFVKEAHVQKHEKFLSLNLENMATHTGVRALAKHANKVRQNFRSDVPSPTHQNTPTPEVGNTTIIGKQHKIVSWMLLKYQHGTNVPRVKVRHSW